MNYKKIDYTKTPTCIMQLPCVNTSINYISTNTTTTTTASTDKARQQFTRTVQN